MRPFIHENFLLRSETARRLYHDVARAAPIIDYHCHLDPRDLAADRRFENIAQLWVTSDPYNFLCGDTKGEASGKGIRLPLFSDGGNPSLESEIQKYPASP